MFLDFRYGGAGLEARVQLSDRSGLHKTATEAAEFGSLNRSTLIYDIISVTAQIKKGSRSVRSRR
jgi:hypothetical protein